MNDSLRTKLAETAAERDRLRRDIEMKDEALNCVRLIWEQERDGLRAEVADLKERVRVANKDREVDGDEIERLEAEKAELVAALRDASFMIDEITDIEGRESMTDAAFAMQVISLAHSKRERIRAALAKCGGNQ